MSQLLYYFPTNREEILSILGSVNFNFKTTPLRIQVAVAGKATPFQFTQSIHANELIALSNNERNFPVLIASSNKFKRNQINFSDIHHLVFRTEQEKDAFRFRGVAEFNPECIDGLVQPELFQSLQENNKKFKIIDLENEQNYHTRILSGLLNIWHVAAWRGFDSFVFESIFQKDDLNIQMLIQYILNLDENETHNELSEHLILAILHSVLKHGQLTSAILLQKITDRWDELWSTDVPPQDEVIWFKYLTSIINSTQVLNLDKLTDDGGSVFLRAATLMIMSDDLNVLKNFSDQSSGIGSKVLYLAAFLIGLKTPLYRRPWQDKKNAIPLIEECAAIIDNRKLTRLLKPLKNALFLSQGILIKTESVEACKLDIYHMNQRYYRVYTEGIKLSEKPVDVWIFDKNLKSYYVDWVSYPNLEDLKKLIGLFNLGIIETK